jgi:hypothetical protein
MTFLIGENSINNFCAGVNCRSFAPLLPRANLAYSCNIDEFFAVAGPVFVFWLQVLFFVFCIFCKMEVEGPTEITPNNSSTGGNNVNNGVAGSKDVNNFVHLPFNPELVDVHRVSSSGQRIKLQVEVNSDYKFLTICDPASSISFILIIKCYNTIAILQSNVSIPYPRHVHLSVNSLHLSFLTILYQFFFS